jgi:uncharacterized protein YutE (UPF0331/DUF86 family)
MAEFSMRFKDKKEEFNVYLKELKEIIPSSFNDYKKDNIIKAACERYSERIIELMLKLANLVLKKEGIIDRDKSFQVLADLGLIDSDLALKLEKIKGMRNLMVHQYDSFDEEVFYNNLKNLIEDSKKFMNKLEGYR